MNLNQKLLAQDNLSEASNIDEMLEKIWTDILTNKIQHIKENSTKHGLGIHLYKFLPRSALDIEKSSSKDAKKSDNCEYYFIPRSLNSESPWMKFIRTIRGQMSETNTEGVIIGDKETNTAGDNETMNKDNKVTNTTFLLRATEKSHLIVIAIPNSDSLTSDHIISVKLLDLN